MLRLGTAHRDITPRFGIALGGWGPGNYGNDLHRPLEARALWISNDHQVAVVVTLDLLGLASGLCEDIRGRIEERLAVPAASVMLACSHTHSGPVLPPWAPEGVDPPDDTYIADLVEKIVSCVAVARQSLVPVRVGHGSGTCDLGVSRRLPWNDGMAGFPPRADPAGAVDPEVGVLRFDDETGSPVAVLMSYGCHPTVSGISNWISPDFPGAARDTIEEVFPTAMAMFVLGNCGDVRSNYTNPDGSFRWDNSTELVDEAGQWVGSIAAKIAGGIRPTSRPVLGTGKATRSVHTQDNRLLEHSEFFAFDFGVACLVSNPAECFSSIGLEVRRARAKPLLFASVTNGFFGYVPTEAAYRFGGYEVEISWKSFGLRAPARSDTHGEFRDGMLEAVQQGERRSQP